MTRRKAFENYITQNLDKIYWFAFTYTRTREVAEDIVNDSVVKALKALHTLQDPTRMGAWFYRIVANTALSWIRSSKRELNLDQALAEAIPDQEDGFSDLNFNQMIQMLDSKSRCIVVLRYFEDRSFDDIAHILDENANTVKTRLYRALKVLRIEMEGSRNE